MSSPPIDYALLFKLFRDDFATDLLARQAESIRRVARIYNKGYVPTCHVPRHHVALCRARQSPPNARARALHSLRTMARVLLHPRLQLPRRRTAAAARSDAHLCGRSGRAWSNICGAHV